MRAVKTKDIIKAFETATKTAKVVIQLVEVVKKRK